LCLKFAKSVVFSIDIYQILPGGTLNFLRTMLDTEKKRCKKIKME